MANKKATTSRTRIDGSCLAAKARLVSRVVTSIYDDAALRPLGVKVSQLNILAVTHYLGVARPAVVCKTLHLDNSTLSRNVERMRANGWLETVPAPGRSQPFQLTPAGHALLRKAESAWTEAQETARKTLGDDLVQALSKPLTRLCRADESE